MISIKLSNVTKHYHKRTVLNNLSYDFKKGVIYMLVGENGAGKTTLLKAILGLIKYKGTIEKAEETISYIPEKFNYPDYITVYQFLKSIIEIKKIKISMTELDQILFKWGISGEYVINNLSKGMKQKVLIIQALLTDSLVYIFDEPLNGLDISSQAMFILEVGKLKKNNATVIISSHFPSQYSLIVDTIISLSEGVVNDCPI